MTNKEFNEYVKNYFKYADKNFRKGIINSFNDISVNQLSWDTICKHLNKIRYQKNVLLEFYSHLLDNNIEFGKDTEYLRKNKWIFSLPELGKSTLYFDNFFEGSRPEKIFLYSSDNVKKIFYIDIDSPSLRKILQGYINNRFKFTKNFTQLNIFIKSFKLSLSKCDRMPETYTDFTYETFIEQYKVLKGMTHNRKNDIAFNELRHFYVYLLDMLEKMGETYKIFEESTGIDRVFLKNKKFNNLYEKGFKVINYNKYEDIPKHDKWMLNPNGYEKSSVSIKPLEYRMVNFSVIEDIEMRKLVKEYFIYSNKSLATLLTEIGSIFGYFKFIQNDKIKRESNQVINFGNRKDNYNEIFSEFKILMFIEYKSSKASGYAKAGGSLSQLKRFIEFVDNKKIYNIDSKIYNYFKFKRDSKQLSSKVIVKEDLEKIAKEIKTNMKSGSYNDKIFWFYFYLAISTNFRPSEILSLKRDCIVSTMKTGEYKVVSENINRINMKTKASAGKSIEVNPSEYTLRIIKEAIEFTQELANESPNKIKDLIFIKRDKSGYIVPVSNESIRYHLDKLNKKLELVNGPYAAYDFRHTYMTKLFEDAVKNDKVNLAILASGHKDISTTIKHYIRPDVRNYLETFYKVNIGNIDIKGRIIDNISDINMEMPKDLREVTVGECGGICTGECDIIENIDCLICKKYVVPVDNIPLFEKKLDLLNNQIANEQILHEKEHLVSIKKLYVAYLSAMYSYKKKENN
ncbi:site-specific integrase [Haloimpatiens massiliensis]|uniref:site-specific integrase n=1 Tax=Haloimpatiens massiliensis TaxID=1658110 RepID=UPI0015E0BE54|nr:site-specific integrase [Haloimpatiens massiliensis]